MASMGDDGADQEVRSLTKLDRELVSTAIGVLENAEARSEGRSVATSETRLALLVLHRYLRDPEPIRLFWERAENASQAPDRGLAEPLALIRARLAECGFALPDRGSRGPSA